jgi:hypothetical protein
MRKAKVDEPRACNLGSTQSGSGKVELIDDRLRQHLWLLADALRQDQRDIGREVTVLGVARSIELDGHAAPEPERLNDAFELICNWNGGHYSEPDEPDDGDDPPLGVSAGLELEGESLLFEDESLLLEAESPLFPSAEGATSAAAAFLYLSLR